MSFSFTFAIVAGIMLVVKGGERMALITCPECGKQISDKAASCPGCGYPLADEDLDIVQENTNIVEINGVNVDIYDLYELYSGNRVKIAQAIQKMTGIGTTESVEMTKQYLKDRGLRPMNWADEIFDTFGGDTSAKRVEKKQEEKRHLKQLKKEKIPFCPKCHSTSITFSSKKLSIGRALVGGAVAGRTGAVLGGLSSGKGYAVCLNCGKRWKV